MPCRITQSGILVENAIDFILKKQDEDSFFIKAFGFDIDLNNHFQFQLDAERTRIIESDYNTRLFENIYKILLNKYYDQIAKIKSSVFFPCGGVYYPGLIDVLLKSEEVEHCFHKNFRNNIDDYAKYNRMNFGAKFDTAKLYMVGFERNSPISIVDIKANAELDTIIILHQSLLKQNNEHVTNKTTKKRNIEKLTKALSSISNLNKIIYLPLNADSFLLPLYDNFDFSLVSKSTKYRLLKIEKKSAQPISDKIELFESFK